MSSAQSKVSTVFFYHTSKWNFKKALSIHYRQACSALCWTRSPRILFHVTITNILHSTIQNKIKLECYLMHIFHQIMTKQIYFVLCFYGGNSCIFPPISIYCIICICPTNSSNWEDLCLVARDFGEQVMAVISEGGWRTIRSRVKATSSCVSWF